MLTPMIDKPMNRAIGLIAASGATYPVYSPPTDDGSPAMTGHSAFGRSVIFLTRSTRLIALRFLAAHARPAADRADGDIVAARRPASVPFSWASGPRQPLDRLRNARGRNERRTPSGATTAPRSPRTLVDLGDIDEVRGSWGQRERRPGPPNSCHAGPLRRARLARPNLASRVVGCFHQSRDRRSRS